MTQYEKMIKTPVSKLVLTLSVPTIISMLVTNIYNLADTAFVGQLGTSASGAVGIVFGFMSIIQAFGFMFGQGSGSMIARLLGKQDNVRASYNATLGFTASFICGAAIMLIGATNIHTIVTALGSTPTIAPYAKTYITYILFSAPFMCSSFTLNNILRYEGRAALGMIGLMTGGLLNIACDPIFMFALDMGIAGAGLATAISQFVSWGILLGMFLLGKTESKLKPSDLRHCSLSMLGNIMATGFPSLLRQGLNSITTVLLNSCCAVYGDAAVAAMSIVSRIIFFSFSIALGIGQGFQPVAGFNYGAGKFGRLKKAFIFTTIAAECIILVGSTVLFVFAGSLIGIFRDDPEVIEVGIRALRLQAISMVLLPPCMTIEMLFQSTGKRLGASIMSSLRSGLLFIPTLLILANVRGLPGIQEAQPLSLLLSAPVSIPFGILFFRRLPKEDSPDKQESMTQ